MSENGNAPGVWILSHPCREHDCPCDCEDFMRYDLWELFDADRNRLGIVQQFDEKAPFYGNSKNGRTGAMPSLHTAKKAVERMVVEH